MRARSHSSHGGKGGCLRHGRSEEEGQGKEMVPIHVGNNSSIDHAKNPGALYNWLTPNFPFGS